MALVTVAMGISAFSGRCEAELLPGQTSGSGQRSFRVLSFGRGRLSCSSHGSEAGTEWQGGCFPPGMAGSRNFSLSSISRKDIMALTGEAADATGIPYVMDAYRAEAIAIIDG